MSLSGLSAPRLPYQGPRLSLTCSHILTHTICLPAILCHPPEGVSACFERGLFARSASLPLPLGSQVSWRSPRKGRAQGPPGSQVRRLPALPLASWRWHLAPSHSTTGAFLNCPAIS